MDDLFEKYDLIDKILEGNSYSVIPVEWVEAALMEAEEAAHLKGKVEGLELAAAITDEQYLDLIHVGEYQGNYIYDGYLEKVINDEIAAILKVTEDGNS